MFHSQDESMSNDENSTLRGGAPNSPLGKGSVDLLTKSRVYGGRPVSAESNAMLARSEPRNKHFLQKTLRASKEVHRSPLCCSSPGESKPRKTIRRRRKGWKTFSDRLVSPTITSLAKCGALDHMRKWKRSRLRPLSEQAVQLTQNIMFYALFEEYPFRILE